MLGIESTNKPIRGTFAKEMRERLIRARKGIMTPEEIRMNEEYQKSLQRFHAIWK